MCPEPDETVLPEGFEEATAPELLVGRYAIGPLLGRGGAGQVHRAVDQLSGEEVAVKFIRPSTPAAARQLRRELVALRLLDLPGVVRLLDDGVVEGQAFLVMPLLDGGSFGTLADRPWEAWRDQALSVLEALGRVHFVGMVHGDLKPANILLDSQGRPHLADFGLASGRVVSEDDGVPAGTPRYMAPEQKRGDAIDPRTDLYAAGVMLLEMAPDAPVRAVFEWMCSEDPSERPGSVEEVLTALGGDDRALFGRPALAEVSTEAELRCLFADTEPSFLHLAEDAASVLFARTDGVRRGVERELNRWVRGGLCHWDEGAVVLDRQAVDRLLAEQGALRFEVSLDGAREAWAVGDSARALAILESLAGPGTVEVGEAIVDLLLVQWRPLALKRGVYLAQRHGWEEARTLLAAAQQIIAGGVARGLDALRPQRFTGEMEGWRLTLGIMAAARRKAEPLGPWFEAADRWVGEDSIRGARAATWRARVAYLDGRFSDALALERIGLDGAPRPLTRLTRLTTAAAVALEVPSMEEARAWATEAIGLARQMRVPAQEVRAVWVLRTAALRTGAPSPPEPALVEAAVAVSVALASQLALTEAAAAWHLGSGQAGVLASRARALFSGVAHHDGMVLSAALAFASGSGAPPTKAEIVPMIPQLRLQALALCAIGGQAHDLKPEVVWDSVRSRWLEVLTGEECFQALAQNSSPSSE